MKRIRLLLLLCSLLPVCMVTVNGELPPELPGDEKIIAHHENNLLGEQGRGTKNDYLAVPMCGSAHRDRHNNPGDFWERHCLKPWRIVIRCLIQYIEERLR